MNQLIIRKKEEKKFQSKTIAAIEELGGSAIHLEPIGHPGFPDLLVTYRDRYCLVELKSVPKITGEKIGSIFQSGQLPWYVLRNQHSRPVLVAIKNEELNQYILLWMDAGTNLYSLMEVPVSFFASAWDLGFDEMIEKIMKEVGINDFYGA